MHSAGSIGRLGCVLQISCNFPNLLFCAYLLQICISSTLNLLLLAAVLLQLVGFYTPAAAICGFFIELQLSQSDVVCTSLAGALTHYLYSTLNLLLPAAVLLLGLSTAGGCKPRVLRMQWMQWCTRQRRSTKEKVLPWMCRRDGQHHKREAAERLCSYLVGSGSNIWLRRRVDESAIMF